MCCLLAHNYYCRGSGDLFTEVSVQGSQQQSRAVSWSKTHFIVLLQCSHLSKQPGQEVPQLACLDRLQHTVCTQVFLSAHLPSLLRLRPHKHTHTQPALNSRPSGQPHQNLCTYVQCAILGPIETACVHSQFHVLPKQRTLQWQKLPIQQTDSSSAPQDQKTPNTHFTQEKSPTQSR